MKVVRDCHLGKEVFPGNVKSCTTFDYLLFCNDVICVNLIHFIPLVSFYTHWKHQKTFSFLILSVGIERDQWGKMSQ